MSGAFPLLSSFHFRYPSPGASSATPDLPAASTPDIAEGNLNPSRSVRKCPPASPGAAHCDRSRRMHSTIWLRRTRKYGRAHPCHVLCALTSPHRQGLARIRPPGRPRLLRFPDVHGFGALDKIYPVVNGIHNPPPEFLTSGARVRQWRGFNNQRQQYEIENIEKANAKRAVTESRNRGRASRIAKIEQSLSSPTPLPAWIWIALPPDL